MVRVNQLSYAFDEWLRFYRENIAAKVSTMDANPILNSGSVEQYKLYLQAALASPTSPGIDLKNVHNDSYVAVYTNSHLLLQ